MLCRQRIALSGIGAKVYFGIPIRGMAIYMC